MKKILLGLLSLSIVLVVWFNQMDDTIEENKEPTLTYIAPDLDVSTISEEDMAILLSQGWDFSGDVPTLILTEEEAGGEIADDVAGTVINLSEFLDDSHQNVSEAE